MSPLIRNLANNLKFSTFFPNSAASSIDIDNIAISNNQLMNSQFIQNQHQSVLVPLAEQSVSGTQKPLLGSLAQQPCIETSQV